MAAAELLPDLVPRLASVVVKGIGRGAARLGWRTASLQPTIELTTQLREVPPGVYCGWATLGPQGKRPFTIHPHKDEVFKATVAVGVNPSYRGKEPQFNKIAEACVNGCGVSGKGDCAVAATAAAVACCRLELRARNG